MTEVVPHSMTYTLPSSGGKERYGISSKKKKRKKKRKRKKERYGNILQCTIKRAKSTE